MRRARNAIEQVPAKRRRRAGEPEQTTHFEGKTLVVTVGGAVEIRLAREGAGLRATCGYQGCGAAMVGAGAALQAFYDEHYKLHTEAPPAPATPEVDVQRLGMIEQLVDDVRKLQGDELEVVRLVVEGLLYDGRPQYGVLDLDTDTRDLELESIAEGRDQVVYDLGDLIKRIRRRARRLTTATTA